MRASILTVPLLSITLIFTFCLVNAHKTLDFGVLGSFLYILPSMFLVQEVSSSIQDDFKAGIVENWFGNGGDVLSYMLFKLSGFSITLVMPFVVMVCAYLLFSYDLTYVGYMGLSLFFLSISFVSLGCLIGLSANYKAYIGILLLPLLIPSFLWLVSGIETGEYTAPLALSFGVTLMSISLSLLLSCFVKQNLF